MGEIELFARELKRLEKYRAYKPVVIGITGTNGKTTTTVLTSKMAAASCSTVVAGNIGPSALMELDRHLQDNTLPEVWVLELSSFQLQTTTSLNCTAAAFLNLTEDHVDWHGRWPLTKPRKTESFLKKPFECSIATMLPPCVRLNRPCLSPSVIRLLKRRRVRHCDRRGWSSGLPADSSCGFLETQKQAALFWRDATQELLMPVEALRIRGRHNAMNALAALALIDAVGLPLGPALQVLKNYEGEAHRVQPVLSVNDIEFIDDSKGTNVAPSKLRSKAWVNPAAV